MDGGGPPARGQVLIGMRVPTTPPSLCADLFLENNRVIRLGNPPFRIALLTRVSGVQFAQCDASREKKRAIPAYNRLG
jgi:hypothetical protein